MPAVAYQLFGADPNTGQMPQIVENRVTILAEESFSALYADLLSRVEALEAFVATPTPDYEGLYSVSGNPDSDGLYLIPNNLSPDSDGLYQIGA